MIPFASDEWIEALDEALRSSEQLRASTSDVALTIRQTLTERPDGDVSWHIVVDHGSVRARPGPGDHADVTFIQDDRTAREIGAGTISVQTAFMIGRLRIGGDTAKLMEHAGAFGALDDLFDELRAVTEY